MRIHGWWLRLLPTFLLCVVATGVVAEEGDIRGYVLYRVLTGQEPAPTAKAPISVRADAGGGQVEVDIEFGSDCHEKTTFAWTFDRDVRYLPVGDEFAVTTTVGVSGDCARNRNPFAMAGSMVGSIRNRLSAKEKNARAVTLVSIPNTEATMRIYGKAGMSRVGTGTDRFEMRGNLRNAPFLYFHLRFNATSGREAYYGGVAYLFRAVYGDTPPDDTPIEMDNPGAGSETTASIPPSSAPPETSDVPTGTPRDPATATPPPGMPPESGSTPPSAPPGGPSTEPCLDPGVQRCIDRWLDQLVLLRNRNLPERAPWSISRYGHLVNDLVRSVQAPDGWATKYKSSKYCYVWIHYATEHHETVYGGQLPPLHDYAFDCPAGTGTGPATPVPGEPGSPGVPGGGPPTLGPGEGPGSGGGHVPPGVHTRTLLADRRVIGEGQRVLVPVFLLQPDGVANMNFTVTYDPSVVVPDGKVVKGGLLSGTRLEANPANPGVIRVAFAQASGLTEDGVVVYLPFRAVGAPGQKTPLRLRVTDIDDPAGSTLPIEFVHGEIVIRGAGQGTPGDCDGDGQLTIADALCALKMSVGLMPVDMNLDLSGDGQVTSGDAREIIQRIP